MTDINTTTFALQVMREDLENGVVSTTMIETYKLKLSVKLVNVKQVGATITGGVQVSLETPFGGLSNTFPFSINTGLPNPIQIPLGSLGGFPVLAEFSYDIPKKMVCVALVVGPFTSGKLCVNW